MFMNANARNRKFWLPMHFLKKVSEASNGAISEWDNKRKTFFRGKGVEKFFGEPVKRQIEEKDFWTDSFDSENLFVQKKGEIYLLHLEKKIL